MDRYRYRCASLEGSKEALYALLVEIVLKIIKPKLKAILVTQNRMK